MEVEESNEPMKVQRRGNQFEFELPQDEDAPEETDRETLEPPQTTAINNIPENRPLFSLQPISI